MSTNHLPGLGPVLLLGLSSLGASVSAEQHEHREHGAHEHGHGTLEVVADGHDLVIGFRIPAVNVIGFEYEARTEEEREAVKTALATFADGAALLVPTASAECALEAHEVSIGSEGLGDHDEHHDHDEHEKHAEHEKDGDHDEHHDHEKHAEHDEHEEGESHSELRAEYRFHCEEPAALERLEVRLFEHLRDVEELDAAVVTATKQGAAELTADDNVLTLAR